MRDATFGELVIALLAAGAIIGAFKAGVCVGEIRARCTRVHTSARRKEIARVA